MTHEERPEPNHDAVNDRAIVILGSRSPRRRELLASIVGQDRMRVLPPSSPDEPGFAGLNDDAKIEQQLKRIVQFKHDDVLRQFVRATPASSRQNAVFIVAADTIVIASGPEQSRVVLGHPDPQHWADDVRSWFRRWLSDQTHEVWTGLHLSAGERCVSFVTKSKVTFCDVDEERLEWYISTGESPGKAGGYAIQGHGAAFVTYLSGSLTNVIGLPVMETLSGLASLGWK